LLLSERDEEEREPLLPADEEAGLSPLLLLELLEEVVRAVELTGALRTDGALCMDDWIIESRRGWSGTAMSRPYVMQFLR
jgi:hypothetical protein